MAMHWLTIILCIWLNSNLDGAIAEHQSRLLRRGSIRNSSKLACQESGVENYHVSEEELATKWQSRPQELPRSSEESGVERLFRYGNTFIGPVESAKDMDNDAPPKTGSTASDDENDDDNEANEDVASGDDSEDAKIDEKLFAARVSCLLRAVHESTKAICENFKKLDTGLASYRQPGEIDSKNRSRTMFNRCRTNNKHRTYDKAEQEEYFNEQNNIHRNVNAELNLKPRSSSNENLSDRKTLCQKKVKQLKLKAIAEKRLQVKKPTNELRLPVGVPTARLFVPPLLQLLSRRTALSINKHQLSENRRFLQVLNAMRLSRAVHAAAATRGKQRQGKTKLQHHVDHFKTNLQKIISNQAAIAKQLSGLLSGMHEAAAAG